MYATWGALSKSRRETLSQPPHRLGPPKLGADDCTASIGSVAWSGARFFDTGDGDLDLQIPADANVSVRANTIHGTVTSEFPLTIKKAPFGISTQASGTLGADGRSLHLSTLNGNITLRRGPPSGQ